MRLRYAITGVLAAAGGLAAAELAAALTKPSSSPVIAIGESVIDATPTPVKEFAVKTVGTYDKPLLLAGIFAAVAVIAAAIGLIARRRRALALVLMAAFGLVAAAAALTRPASRPLDALPATLAALTAATLLAYLTRPTRPAPAPPSAPAPSAPASPEGGRGGARGGVVRRRELLVTAAGVVATAALAKVTGVVKGRAATVTLRPPDSPAPALVTSPGFYTSNKEFYRVDTSLTVPRVDVERWKLTVKGQRPVELTFDDLIRMPLIERDITLNCVSNEVGGPYIGTARWIGVPLKDVLQKAGVQSGFDQLVARSTEGMTIGTPIETVLDGRDAMIAVGMNGEALPAEHGFPARMLTPGVYGYAGSCKWISALELSTFDSFDAYWVRRGWAARAPVKTASRIDLPKPFAKLPAGSTTIAGVAWAQRRGIAEVEVQIDDGAWQQATITAAPSTDTWVQWRYTWAAAPGGHSLRVRAKDRLGDLQTADRATPFPDGATGWHTIAVTVN